MESTGPFEHCDKIRVETFELPIFSVRTLRRTISAGILAPKLPVTYRTPAITLPNFSVIKINLKRLQVLVEESDTTAMRQQLKECRRADGILGSKFVEQRNASSQSLSYGITIDKSGKGISRTLVGNTDHNNFVYVRRASP